LVTTRSIVNVSKYFAAAALLVWVIQNNWSPRDKKAEIVLAASTVGLIASPPGAGPLTAAVAAVPGRTDGKGLGYVWERHVVRREPINKRFLAGAFAIYCCAVLLTLVRWFVLVRAQGLPFRIRDALRLGMVGFFFNTFMPGSVGGDIIKAAALAVGQSRRTVAVATVIMDRIIALWALVAFVACVGGTFWAAGLLGEGLARQTAEKILIVASIIVAVSVVVWVIMGFLPDKRSERFAGRLERIPKVGASAAEFWRAVWMYRCRQRSVFVVLAMAWVSHFGFVLAFYCSANALWSPDLGPIPTLTQHFLLVPIGLVMQALIPTPGGAGAGEWGFAALYLLFGAAEANGVLGSLVQRCINWTIGLVGFGIYSRMKATRTVPEPPGELAPTTA
jgi:uncharacterized protein (TIRG00374 family)